MKRILNFLILLALVFCIASCAPKKAVVKATASYEEVLKEHTKDSKAYKDMETKLIAYATYKDNVFMNALIDKKAEKLLYNSARVDLLKIQAQRNNEVRISFFVAAYTPDNRFADFSREKGLWKFYVKEGDSEPLEAFSVKKVSRGDRPEYEVLYPYISTWMQLYEIRFNKSSTSQPLTLIITGQLGKMELTYN